jgi:uncharacterized RDD family membrane protein YckC
MAEEPKQGTSIVTRRLLAIGLDVVAVGLVAALLGSLLSWGAPLGAVGAAFVLWVIVPAATGQSLGKRVFALRVERLDGQPPGYLWGTVRLAGYAVNVLTLGLGAGLALRNADGRGLHDMLAGTRVLDARALPLIPPAPALAPAAVAVPPPPAPPPVKPTATDYRILRLRLKGLLTSDVITREEFETQLKAIDAREAEEAQHGQSAG